jgi:hypothetical protein
MDKRTDNNRAMAKRKIMYGISTSANSNKTKMWMKYIPEANDPK